MISIQTHVADTIFKLCHLCYYLMPASFNLFCVPVTICMVTENMIIGLNG